MCFTICAGVGWAWLARQKQLSSCELEVPSGVMLNPMGLYDLEALGYLFGVFEKYLVHTVGVYENIFSICQSTS